MAENGWLAQPEPGNPFAIAQQRMVKTLVDSGDTAAANGLAWAYSRWVAEVGNRPLVNVHRRTLDDTWRQVIRYFGGEAALKLIAAPHDTLVAAYPAYGVEPTPEPAATVAPVDPDPPCGHMLRGIRKPYCARCQRAAGVQAIPQAELDAGSKCQPDGFMFDAFCNPRVRYVRVSYDGQHLILSLPEVEAWKMEAEAAAASLGQTDPHTYSDVYLSEEEADALPEFDGF